MVGKSGDIEKERTQKKALNSAVDAKSDTGKDNSSHNSQTTVAHQSEQDRVKGMLADLENTKDVRTVAPNLSQGDTAQGNAIQQIKQQMLDKKQDELQKEKPKGGVEIKGILATLDDMKEELKDVKPGQAEQEKLDMEKARRKAEQKARESDVGGADLYKRT